MAVEQSGLSLIQGNDVLALLLNITGTLAHSFDRPIPLSLYSLPFLVESENRQEPLYEW